MMVGLSAVSAPVFDHDGRPPLTCVVLCNTVDTSGDGPIVTLVRAKAQDLSARMGYRTKMAG
jgi:DNA-binding IclR family transcriptional regulator